MTGGGTPDGTGAARSVLGRALSVLGAFTDASPELALADIVTLTGLPPATAHRIVAELVAWGALERVGRGRYRIGLRLWRIGALAPAARTLREAALAPMQDLAAVTGHVVHLVVLDGFRALFVERLPGREDLTVRSRVGRDMPLHASGPGKVLLAHAPTAFVEQVITRGLPRLASGTITDPGTLRAALAEIRRTGHCLSREEMTEGASSIAAPVVGADGTVVAALGVVVPASAALPPYVPAVMVAAATASRNLGARPPSR
ncbi:IclR family transcriptional regulator [Actinomycetospora corticicola]|uniref:DNA-binding IclR family transcriptional regulator n=1 Tax=Actinomycetospora corticicola TaxID=663602 RepID=A0A7Y9DUM1_9PSEU|nr:IclR family transcriptional regulator [Actinomycetospora corticicola]NYD35734.1 DNA-binding IclR family transcriptional regulator [Actinomycetospora corticicola]